MRLSLYTDYALRVLIYLAGRPERSQVAQVASYFEISKDHVAKAVQRLAKLGYVRSIRGIGGGIELGRPADQVTIGEIVIAFEGNMHLLECVDGGGNCVIKSSCRLKGVLAQAEQLQSDYLNSVLLSDVVKPGGQLVELNLPASPT